MSRARTTRRTATIALAAATALTLAACGGGGGFDDETDAGDNGAGDGAEDNGEALTVLIGSSGDAETQAVQAAAAAWSAESGTEVEVVAATDLPQELSQGFAADDPPDVFYLGADNLASYASNGSLLPYVDQLENADDFYPVLLQSFTYEGTAYCAPKDFSTLGLVINTDAWEAAGLTDDDIPTTWEELSAVAQQLTTDTQVGLSFGAEWQRIGTFMAQAGGGLTNPEGNEATVDTPENLAALEYVQQMLADGTLAYPGDINAGWGGEALGLGAAAMVIEGNWIVGAMTNNYPDVSYRVVELPAGPGGQGTLQFTNCWGVAADGGNTAGAVDLVGFLTSSEQQMEFAAAFGVMPSVQSVNEEWTEQFPEQAAFLAGADYAQGGPVAQGAADVISDFNSQLQGLKDADPQAILTAVQANLEAVLG
ncbi:extracellular solute-binding protein [Pseudactinotalea suaedae]|uniref:extracellular solute-binding protein n=1 Tax=Pseudactinotalea suaedae TaxID=1524924 RepID=UPI0012E15C20|nr:extracellular solute-binding protein [Pseudactinotalea suaedae]